MKNPVAIEKYFQELLAHLSFPVSPKERLLAVKHFIDLLIENPDGAESYLLEVVQFLPGIVRDLDYNGIEPHVIRTLYENLNALFDQYPELRTIAGVDRALDSLRVITAQLYAFVGNPRVMLAFLNKNYAVAPPRWFNSLKIEPSMTPFEIISIVSDAAAKHNDQIIYEIDRVIGEWKKLREPRDAETVAPVVEVTYDSGLVNQVHGGSLRRIRVNIVGETRHRYDELHPDVAIYGARLPVDYSMTKSIRAARSLIAETHPSLKERYVTGQVIFRNRNAMHEGSSANAAIAAIAYCDILDTLEQRVTYQIAPCVAITGDIADDGSVLSVDIEGLKKKIRAAMFSYIDYIVVPKQHVETAEQEIESVRKFYPDRTITVIGIKHIREIFFDRRLSIRKELSSFSYTGKQLWTHKYSIMSILTIFVLLGIIARLTLGPADRNPVSGYFEGEYLVVVNSSDQVIDRIWVSEEVAAHHSYIVDTYYGLDWRLFSFFDVTGDGYNELIWASDHRHPDQYTSILYCKSIVRDEIVWEKVISFDFNFPRKPYANGNSVGITSLVIDDLDGDGIADIIITGSVQRYFPGFVARLNSVTGELMDYYVHTGAVRSVYTADVTGNGRKEIIAGGINNAFNQAFVAVLDSRYMSGHSPLQGDYEIAGYEKAQELAYIRIPRTVLGEALQHRTRYNEFYRIMPNPDSGEFQAAIYEFFERNPQIAIYEVPVSRYYITFNYDLEVLNIGTDNGYDMMAKLLYNRGIIDTIPDYDYFQDYAKTLLYWNGNGWQNEPVLNLPVDHVQFTGMW